MLQPQDLVTINIRAQAEQLDLIDQAAECLGRNRCDFMLEAACREAEDVLLCGFVLDSKNIADLQALLDRPPAPTDELRRLLSASTPRDLPR